MSTPDRMDVGGQNSSSWKRNLIVLKYPARSQLSAASFLLPLLSLHLQLEVLPGGKRASEFLLVDVFFSSVAESCPTFATPWTATHQASLSITSSWSLLKLMIVFYLTLIKRLGSFFLSSESHCLSPGLGPLKALVWLGSGSQHSVSF